MYTNADRRYWNYRFDRIETMLAELGATILEKETEQMAKLDDLKTEVSAVGTVVDSAVTLLDGLHQQLADAAASGDPAAVDKIISDLGTKKDELAAAVARNTAAADEVGDAHAAGM